MEQKERFYHKCPECGLMIPWKHARCNCGYQFKKRAPFSLRRSSIAEEETGDALKDILTQAKQEQAAAFHAGELAERAKNDAEWAYFFEKAQLENPRSGDLIMTREDFYKWEKEADTTHSESAHHEKKDSTVDQSEQIFNQGEIEAKNEQKHETIFEFVSKEEQAYSSIMNYASELQSCFASLLYSDMQDVSFYFSVAALCAWAERFLNQKREWTEYIVDWAASDSLEEKYAEAMKTAMLSATDNVALALGGLTGIRAMDAFISSLVKLLLIKEDTSIDAKIHILLTSFSVHYISNTKEGY